MLLRVLGAGLATAVLMGAAAPASTCIFAPQRLHHFDRALQQMDDVPPLRPLVVAADTFRRSGVTCTEQSCVATSCGATGTVRIELAPSADEVAAPEELGYRLRVVEGELPASLQSSIGVALAGGVPLLLHAGFEEVSALDAVLVAVAVDGAGNESPPSERFALRFDGCTLAAVGDRCEDELAPDSDLGRLWEEQLAAVGARSPAVGDAAEDLAEGVVERGGEAELEGEVEDPRRPPPTGLACSVRPSSPAGGSAAALASAVLLAAWMRRRASVGRRIGPR